MAESNNAPRKVGSTPPEGEDNQGGAAGDNNPTAEQGNTTAADGNSTAGDQQAPPPDDNATTSRATNTSAGRVGTVTDAGAQPPDRPDQPRSPYGRATGLPAPTVGNEDAGDLELKPMGADRPPMTVAGPLEADGPGTGDQAWQRSEKAYLRTNQHELEDAQQRASDANTEIILLRTNRQDNRVAFFEADDLHPHGHLYIAGMDTPPVYGALTPGVEAALLRGDIVETDERGNYVPRRAGGRR